MSYLQAIEEQIVGRLTPLQAKHFFHLFNAPDTRNVLNPQAKALVFFAGESISEPQPNQVPIANQTQIKLYQDSVLRWAIALQLVNLQTHTPIYPLIEAIESQLTGFYPTVPGTNLEFFIPSGTNFQSLDNGAQWKYVLNFSIRKYAR